MLNDYTIVSENRNYKNGGGVGMYVSKKLNFIIRPDLGLNVPGTIESIFIEIITFGKNIGTIYRPPYVFFIKLTKVRKEHILWVILM